MRAGAIKDVATVNVGFFRASAFAAADHDDDVAAVSF